MKEKASIFISDCHLSDKNIERNKLFCKKLNEYGKNKNIYILGDLFDAWIGDDNIGNWLEPIGACMQELAKNGSQIFIMHGNHDFLMGEKMFNLLSAKHIKDPCIINETIMLTHGDDFCLQDQAYQRIKPILQNKISKYAFLQLSLAARKKIAIKLQAQGKPKLIDYKKINSLFDGKIQTIIHGHTHKKYMQGKINQVIGLPAWENDAKILRLKHESFNWLEEGHYHD